MTFPAAPPPVPGIVHTDVRVGRHRWHVATAGEGPPVVLLHGWPQHWWMWRRVMADLARDHRVYAPDLRGFGWSDAPDGDYSKMGLACDVERLLDELGIESCSLVGHDWGGFVSWLTAIRAPRLVERMVVFSILHPWPVVRPAPRATALALAYQVPLATPGLGTLAQAGGHAVRALLKTGTRQGFTWPAEDLRLFSEQWARPAHARAASALYRTFLTRELAGLARGRYDNRRVEVPVLMATGRHDPVVTPQRIDGGEEHAPLLRRTIIDDAAHFVVEEQPRRVLELIREGLAA